MLGVRSVLGDGAGDDAIQLAAEMIFMLRTVSPIMEQRGLGVL